LKSLGKTWGEKNGKKTRNETVENRAVEKENLWKDVRALRSPKGSGIRG